MPIRAQCPNPTCRQTLEVPDQYAGSQGKCPTCGTMVTFQAGSPGASAPMPPPAPAGAYAPPSAPAPGVGGFAPPPSDAPVGMYPPSAAPAGPPMDPAKLVEMICPPAGLFFLFLMLLACFIPWAGSELVSLNGFALREAGIFFILCLLVTALVGLTYVFRGMVPLAAAVGAGFGSFAVLFFIASLIKCGKYYGGAKFGVILGLIAAIFTVGALVTLAIFRPYEPPLTQSLGSPLMKRHGALFGAIAAGVVLGFVYLVLTAVS